MGCGLGQDACELKRLVGVRGRVVGIDYSEEMIAEARRRGKDVSSSPKFVVCEAHHIGFSSDTSMLREPIESSTPCRSARGI